MINLLSESEKEYVRREYARRRLVVGLCFLFFSLVLASLLLVPSYLLARERYLSYKEQIAPTAGARPSIGEEVAQTVQAVEERMALLRPTAAKLSVSALIASIVEKKGSGITVRYIAYQSKGTAAVFDLSGVAATRESLLSFVANLEKEPRFAKVYSPVSNLVKDKNIEYTIQISVTP